MMYFVLKGLIRQWRRNLIILVLIAGCSALTVVLHGWSQGLKDDLIHKSAAYRTGHLRVVAFAQAQEMDRPSNELALYHADAMQQKLEQQFPELVWLPRIQFQGLIDIPNLYGNTRARGSVAGLGLPLFGEKAEDRDVLKLKTALVRGSLPMNPGEILMSEDLTQNLGLRVGETATFLGQTAYGSLTSRCYTFVGSYRFELEALNKGSIIMDIQDARGLLDLEGAASEITGLFKSQTYSRRKIKAIQHEFNGEHEADDKMYRPFMSSIYDPGVMKETLDDLHGRFLTLMALGVLGAFIFLSAIGLMGRLRRSDEIAIRLAIGERKVHLYWTLFLEWVFLGIAGATPGALLGVAMGYYLEGHGMDWGVLLASHYRDVLMPAQIFARVTPGSGLAGFLAGIFVVVAAMGISYFQVFRRDVAMVVKELNP